MRALLALIGLAGCVALVVATFSLVLQIEVLTTSEIAADIDTERTGWERHGPALLVLAGFALVMLAGALRGARPAALALVAAGLAALAIALVWDLPALDDTGQVGELYEQATAGPESGYYLETAGGALLLLAGGGLFLLPAGAAAGAGGAAGAGRERERREGRTAPEGRAAPRAPRARRLPRRRRRGGDREPAEDDAPTGRREPDDWFADDPT
ncbi:hypothetical protein [Conexibacter sp. SYSU D00693]|uniref:DUF7937 domain-containing protein n=1 Tax=Conexibacter sp. SYSU D00693 TaxID=2812560 RepID=UPI00196B9AF7|nr:hypothetical protein [Conexibacter sp. SYSU D00693]